MKMFIWSDRFSYLAVAHADSVAQARQLLLPEIGEVGDGSCPERDKARKIILNQTPDIFVGHAAEFALTDSAELREMESYASRMAHAFKVATGSEYKDLKSLSQQQGGTGEVPAARKPSGGVIIPRPFENGY